MKKICFQFQSKLTTKEQESYANAGNLVEEVLNALRTVVSFGGEKKESDRYDNYLVPARKASQHKGAFSGLSDGVLKSMLFLSCAGAFWYGVNLIIDDRDKEVKEYTPAILMIVSKMFQQLNIQLIFYSLRLSLVLLLVPIILHVRPPSWNRLQWLVVVLQRFSKLLILHQKLIPCLPTAKS